MCHHEDSVNRKKGSRRERIRERRRERSREIFHFYLPDSIPFQGLMVCWVITCMRVNLAR